MPRKTTKPAEMTPESVAPVIYHNPLASFDLGNANAKVRTAEVSAEFRSISGVLSKARRMGDLHTSLVFTFEGETLVWGDECRDLIDGQPTAFTDRRRYTAGFYRKLFAAALWRSFRHMATEAVLYPVVVCSIPATEFADGLADQVKKTISGPYVLDGLDGVSLFASIEPQNVLIVPEGSGSYFQALAAPGSGLTGRAVAVLDVGYYTSDFLLFNKGNYVAGSARSCNHAVRLVAEAVHRWARQNHRYRGDVWAIDHALDAGCIDVATKCVSLLEPRDAAYADLLDRLIDFYYSSIGDTTPGAVLLAGGGALPLYRFLPDELKEDGWRVVSTNPRRANVDGAFLFLEQRQAKVTGHAETL